MLDFFVGLLIMVCLFAFCLVISYCLYNIKINQSSKQKSVPEKPSTPEVHPTSNIYYINSLEKPKPRAPRKRKIDIPIKQAIISPQEIQRIIIDNSQNEKN